MENFSEFLPQNAGKTHFFRGFWPKNGKNSRLRRKKSRFIAFLPHFTPLYPLFWTFYNPYPPFLILGDPPPPKDFPLWTCMHKFTFRNLFYTYLGQVFLSMLPNNIQDQSPAINEQQSLFLRRLHCNTLFLGYVLIYAGIE